MARKTLGLGLSFIILGGLHTNSVDRECAGGIQLGHGVY